MVFNEKEEEILRDSAILYKKAKFLLIKAEELDKENKSKIGAFDELRHALDHLMRVISIKYNGREDIENPDEYSISNMRKFYGHIYRAGYDALDWLNVSYNERIDDILSKYSIDTIKTVIPDYYSNLKAEILTIKNEIANYRNDKDVNKGNNETFNNYLIKVERLDEIYRHILNREELFTELKKKKLIAKLKDQEKKDHFRKMISYERKVWISLLIFFILMGYTIPMLILTRIYIKQDWLIVLLYAIGIYGFILIFF